MAKIPDIEVRKYHGLNLEGVNMLGDKIFETDSQVMDFYEYLRSATEKVFKQLEEAEKKSWYLASIRQTGSNNRRRAGAGRIHKTLGVSVMSRKDNSNGQF